MEQDGFTLYAENTIGSSQFKTYIKNNAAGNMVAYLMYHPEVNTFRLTYGPMEFLPNATPLKADNKADPTITQLFMEMVYGSDKLTVSGSTITILSMESHLPSEFLRRRVLTACHLIVCQSFHKINQKNPNFRTFYRILHKKFRREQKFVKNVVISTN